MSYFNLNEIVPAAPNDPLVNRLTQLNDNWDDINTKTLKMQNAVGVEDLFTNPVANSVEVGQEILWLQNSYVWDGAAWIPVKDYTSLWSAWTQVPLSASVINRTNFPLQYRTNSGMRRGELRGCIQRDAVPTAWVHNTAVVASNAIAQPIAAFVPVVSSGFITATSLPATPATQTASAECVITPSDGWRLTVKYRGSAGPLNYISVDNVSWWY